ncbi:MAG: DUF2225 domain-containing protein [candidate division Zixibacteria bacterium]|nr:DUF2225 domain-containing protein [candidate division Zixibacteria bacterium]
MSKEQISPIETILVDCPSCNASFLGKKINPEAYRVLETDTDFFPQKSSWLSAGQNQYNPLHYLMQTCPACFFTLEINHLPVRNPLADEGDTHPHKNQIERHKAEFTKPGSVVDKLAHNFRISADPFTQAIFKYLLGIYDEKLKDQYSNYCLGRYYLRLGWLFRDKDDVRYNSSYFPWADLESRLSQLSNKHKNYLSQISQLKELLEKHFLSVDVQPGSEDKGAPENYREVFEMLDRELDPAEKELKQLWELLNGKLVSTTPFGREHFTQKMDLASRLVDLKTVWVGTPLNETEALKFALSYYEDFFKGIPVDHIQGPRIQTAYLIGELYRRVGEYPQSQKYFTLAIGLAQRKIEQEKESYRSAFAQKIMELAHQQKTLSIAQEKRPTA